ncbi:hypothetical protein E4U09_003094 [Claviceps aff. purpurea]|uniref:Uncharacterized protein n=1 Tax=Claviceps aff. purpurea TaxID=1967640 RepID=A0A9P7U0P1_9HYPO|nr:hypothetical protein E4U09_003094 [Claviceps aff. purpurea]
MLVVPCATAKFVESVNAHSRALLSRPRWTNDNGDKWLHCSIVHPPSCAELYECVRVRLVSLEERLQGDCRARFAVRRHATKDEAPQSFTLEQGIQIHGRAAYRRVRDTQTRRKGICAWLDRSAAANWRFMLASQALTRGRPPPWTVVSAQDWPSDVERIIGP